MGDRCNPLSAVSVSLLDGVDGDLHMANFGPTPFHHYYSDWWFGTFFFHYFSIYWE